MFLGLEAHHQKKKQYYSANCCSTEGFLLIEKAAVNQFLLVKASNYRCSDVI